MNIFTIFILSQVVVMSVILLVLKKVLNGNLIDLAIAQVENGQIQQDEPEPTVVVTTHQYLPAVARERLLKAFTKRMPGAKAPEFCVDKKIFGGMIIAVGLRVVDYSLIDRLRKVR